MLIQKNSFKDLFQDKLDSNTSKIGAEKKPLTKSSKTEKKCSFYYFVGHWQMSNLVEWRVVR